MTILERKIKHKLGKFRRRHVAKHGVGLMLPDSPRRLIKRTKSDKEFSFGETKRDSIKIRLAKETFKSTLRRKEKKFKIKRIAKGAPLGIVSKEPIEDKDKFFKWLSTTAGFIEGFTKLINEEHELKSTRLYPYQRSILAADGKNRCICKSRQIGLSQLISLESLAKCMLKSSQTSIFCSFNEDEAKEKIRYAREAYETLPTKYKLSRRLIVDNKTSLEFAPSKGGNTTRMLSHPQRDIRGKAKADIYLDEIAHYIYGRRIYLSAGPATVRGGSLTAASTPFGKKDIFWEIVANEEGDYNDFIKFNIPWWECSFYCKDVKEAKRIAPNMLTDERIAKFATQPLKRMRRMSLLEDFQQEFELEFLDELTSFITLELIRQCMPMDEEKGIGLIPFYSNPIEVMNALDKKIIKGILLAGFDIGRKKDVSEFVIVIEDEATGNQQLILRETFKNAPFRHQENRVREYLKILPILKLGIDATAIGNNLAENLETDYGSRIESISFTNQWKEVAATNVKIRMENKALLLPVDKDVKLQFHSIKKRLTTLGKNRFDVDENAKHHADLFWACVLASSMGLESSSSVADLSKTLPHSDIKEELEDQKAAERLLKTGNRRIFTGSSEGSMVPLVENVDSLITIPFV